MRAIKFPEHTMVIAKDQPEYCQMPAWISEDKKRLVCCWSLSWGERIKLLFTGKIWHSILFFGEPIQPQRLEVEYPFEEKGKT